MRTILMIILLAIASMAIYAKPQCQNFSNHDNKVTIIFTDEKVGKDYAVSDVKLIPAWMGKEYKATSDKTNVKDGVATVTLTFPHITHFSNPKVKLKINGKKTSFHVCQ